MTTATVDLTVAGTGGTINGAVFTNQSTSSGTGIFNTFLQLQDKGIELGYTAMRRPNSTRTPPISTTIRSCSPTSRSSSATAPAERSKGSSIGSSGSTRMKWVAPVGCSRSTSSRYGRRSPAVSPDSRLPARPRPASIMPPGPGSTGPIPITWPTTSTRAATIGSRSTAGSRREAARATCGCSSRTATSSTMPPIATSRCFRNSARRAAATAPAAASRNGASTRRAPVPATPQPSCSTRPRRLTAERRTPPASSSATASPSRTSAISALPA